MKIDNVFNPLDTAISGMRAQNKNIQVISSNVANAQTTDDGTGKAYRRLETIFETNEDGIAGVKIKKIVPDMSEMPKIMKPGHPNADGSGFVTMPNVDIPTEMMNLTIATRTYEANAAIMKRYQKMIETSLELLR